MALSDTVIETVMDVVTLKAVVHVLTLVCNIRLLTVTCHDMNKGREMSYFVKK
jgi:hypothetical protein